ncbi:MAG TPA: hypothetical protein ENI07_02400 [Desulfobacterales bacterium]|nr:hypothetical protein [Desulfobacterales bacterium]
MVIFVSTKHEVWRDEVRALSIALEPDTIWGLFTALKNEGHPILWYLILRIGFMIINSSVILKIASVCIAFGGVVVFYKYAPFPMWQRILFIGGVLPFYEYPVVARNYGISMLFLFLLAKFYTQREEKPFLVAFILVALANTNVHSAIFVCVIAFLWLINVLVYDRSLFDFRRIIILSCSFVIVGIGVVFSAVTTLPTQDSIVTQALSLNISQLLQELWTNIKHPGLHFTVIFFGLSALMRDILMWILIAGLIVRPLMAISLFLGVVLVGLFFSVVYYGALRHQGLVFIFIVSLYWIVYKETMITPIDKLAKYRVLLLKGSVYVVLSAIFLVHIAGAMRLIYRDLVKELSSSRAFGEFIMASKRFQEAIIIGEPDYRLQSLPYYVKNRIFIPREGIFRNYIAQTRANKSKLTMGELLESGRQLRISEMKPVLIVLGHFGLAKQKDKPFIRTIQHNKKFSWTSEEMDDFGASTVKIKEFVTSEKNERYAVYLLPLQKANR